MRTSRTPHTPHTPHTPRSVRPVRFLAATLLTAALALAGCSASAGDKAADTSSGGRARAAEAASPQQGAVDSSTGGGAKNGAGTPAPAVNAVIRTASLTVRVKDVSRALDETRTAVENAGGFIGHENTSRDARGHERTRLVLRVPAEKYEEVLTALQGTGTLVERTAKAEDVTDQVVDVQSRIASQRASVARVRELMDRATRLSDVVALEGELSSRQADLEALLARQSSLKDRTSLATITLSLSETPAKKPVKAAEDDRPGFLDALAGGWHVFVTLLRWIALAVGAVLPFAVCAALLVLLWTRVIRPRVPYRPAHAPFSTAPDKFPAARTAAGPTEEQEDRSGQEGRTDPEGGTGQD
ncbi:DUF4349 domain-containing protein [Streptomyces nodosus]